MTFDKQLTAVESKSNRSCNHRVSEPQAEKCRVTNELIAFVSAGGKLLSMKQSVLTSDGNSPYWPVVCDSTADRQTHMLGRNGFLLSGEWRRDLADVESLGYEVYSIVK